MPIANSTKYSFNDVNLLLKLTVPLVLTGLVESLTGFFSTLFLARLGVRELAAGALVSRIFITLMVVVWGALCSVSVLVAQKQGAKNEKDIARALRDGMLLAGVLAIPSMLLLWNIAPILLLTGQDPAMVKLAEAYMRALTWGVLPDFLSLVLMQFLIGLGHTRINMLFTLFWVPTNVFCTYVLVFGKCGFPALGIAGTGWGATMSFWILIVVLVTYLLVHPTYSRYFRYMLPLRPPNFLKELWYIGIPMGAMYFVEVAYFLLLTLLMGYFSHEILAAAQIALQYVMFFSMVTFAIAEAVTVRMGHMLGTKDFYAATRAAYLGIIMAAICMSVIALCYWFFPTVLIAVDLNVHAPQNRDVVAYTKTMLMISAFFQLFEAVRVVLFGALRSLKDTRFTLLASILSFWGIALPIGYLLAEMLHFGALGYWWGMVIGAVFSAALLYWRFRYKIKSIIRMRLLLQTL